ncbi:MAG: M23 family metallopeptidase [Candidatus Nanopelagicaceae bacterium]
MAHGFVSSTDATGNLNLGALVANKVKNAYGMAAEERKAREAEIKALEEKEERTAEEQERLDFLKQQDVERKEGGIKKSFFAKALMSEFGGDRRRRLMGTFSKSPDATRDPSLSKEERFSALLNAKPGEAPATPEEYDDSGEYGAPEGAAPPPQSPIDKLVDIIKSQYSTIAGKISSLGSEEKKGVVSQENNNSHLSRITGVLESIKNYFNKDNDLKEEENQIEKDKIERQLDAEADAKASEEASVMGQGSDLSDFSDTDTLEEQKDRNEDGGGLLGGIVDGVKGILGGLLKGKGGGKTPGVQPTTQYTKPIGPQPLNSPTPWASKGAGERGGMFGQGGFTPRLPSAPTGAPPTPPKLSEGGVVPAVKEQKPTKLAAGGIVTNPTNVNLTPGSSVIPLNRNNALAKTFKAAGQGQPGAEMAEPMVEVMQLPSKVGGGLLLSLLNRIMSKLGGIARFMKPILKRIATPIAAMFGLPATIVSGLFGGPAAAATMDQAPSVADDDFLKKLGGMFKGTGSGGTDPGNPDSAAPDLAGTSVMNEVTAAGLQAAAGTAGAHKDVGVTSGFGNRNTGIPGASTNHQGVDIGTSGQKGYKVAFQRSGTVTHAGPMGGFGNLVIIKDTAGTEYYFAHLANINPEMKVGAQYTGQTIGEIGNTGTSSGEHLHFEKHPNAGAAVDPMGDIGLISIGKQTRKTGQAVPLALLKPEDKPTTPRSRPRGQGSTSGTAVRTAQAARQQGQKGPPPAQGPSQLPVKDPSGADNSYLNWF